MAIDDEPLVFADESPKTSASLNQSNWKILIADDEPNVHLVTQLALGGFQFADKGVELLSAYNEADVKRLMSVHPDIALILLDVVMDSLTSGFDLVRYIREELGNKNVRIILRTGQSGHAPEDKVIIDYDINDFKDKTELTVSKLRTTIISSLRSYKNQVLLDQSREYLQQVIDQTSSCFITVDQANNVKLWNHAAERLFGKPRNEAEGQLIWNLHPWFRSIDFLIHESFRTGKISEHRNVPFQEKGSHLIDLMLTPMKNQSVPELLLRIDDVTEIKQKEEQISFIEKVHAIGNIRRIWTDYLKESRIKIAGLIKSLETLTLDQLRLTLSDINQGLQKPPLPSVEKSSQKGSKFRTLSFDFVTSEIIQRLQQYPGLSFQVGDWESNVYILGDHETLAKSLRQFLEQIAELIAPSGSLKIELSKKWINDDLEKKLGPIREKFYLCFEIAIPESKIPGIQDDSFEILSENLGLQNFYFSFGNLYQTILDHRGFFEMMSNEGMIEFIRIFLPIAMHTEAALSFGKTVYGMGHGNIIVCDDDSLTRQVTASILSQVGFTVITARNGNEALDILSKYRESSRLVILDLLLPGAEGSQVYDQIKNLAPEIPVLFSSGYGKNEKIQAALKEKQVAFLQKPFTMEQLLKQVFEMLAENQSG